MLSKRKRRLGQEITIVLGGGLWSDGTPGRVTILRAETAVQIAKAHPKATVILSGDGRKDFNRQTARTEAWHMARVLRKNGVSGRRLLLETESRDTIGNAVLVWAKFLREQKPRKIYLVTSPFHAERALIAFRGVLGEGWDIEIVLCAEAPGDDVRLAGEPGGIEWMKKFFVDMPAADLQAITDRLLAVGKPYFRSITWLFDALKRVA
jgi:hypothetical protein